MNDSHAVCFRDTPSPAHAADLPTELLDRDDWADVRDALTTWRAAVAAREDADDAYESAEDDHRAALATYERDRAATAARIVAGQANAATVKVKPKPDAAAFAARLDLLADVARQARIRETAAVRALDAAADRHRADTLAWAVEAQQANARSMAEALREVVNAHARTRAARRLAFVSRAGLLAESLTGAGIRATPRDTGPVLVDALVSRVLLEASGEASLSPGAKPDAAFRRLESLANLYAEEDLSAPLTKDRVPPAWWRAVAAS
jgi:hypothetical protein